MARESPERCVNLVSPSDRPRQRRPIANSRKSFSMVSTQKRYSAHALASASNILIIVRVVLELFLADSRGRPFPLSARPRRRFQTLFWWSLFFLYVFHVLLFFFCPFLGLRRSRFPAGLHSFCLWCGIPTVPAIRRKRVLFTLLCSFCLTLDHPTLLQLGPPLFLRSLSLSVIDFPKISVALRLRDHNHQVRYHVPKPARRLRNPP
jgi:hypothetical protein